MGGKSSTTTQQVQIPPEVLARYNAVNARAEQAAGTPFQPYSYNPADFVAQLSPTQLAGIQNINYAADQAQPYYEEATSQLMGAQQAAVPYYGAAADIYGQAYGQAQPLNQMALQQYYGGLGAAGPLSQAALANLSYGQAQGQDITGASLSQLSAAQQAAYPYQQLATQYGLAGATPIGPGYLNTAAYMSPYMQGVVAPTAALLNQQNQQAMAGQTANAIRSGAFGGDRAAIAAANLAQQQQLATGKVLGELMQTGYGQALSTAQQQQQLALQAEQANRAAQAAAAQQFLGIGQQGFGQSLQAAEQQRAAAQQLFGLGATTAQQQAALAQQLYGQQTGTGQAVQGLAQQLYQQGLGLGQAQQGVGKELYGMGAGTAQQLAALGQGAQGAALQGGQAQMGAGQAQQQTAQAGLQALYNQYLQQQGYPFQVAQFLANVAMGTGALSGSTTTTNQPGGLFSDARLKENIEEVGRTHDGQPIYKYNFKGSKKTEIGLLAQEVEKRHPEAVGEKAGFKTVDYDKATKRAGLGHVIDGEYTVREGGHVHPEHSGLGFADGGMPYGMPGAGGLNIPTQMDGPKKLQAPGSPGAGKSVIGDIKDIADTAKAGKDLYDTGSKLASFMGFADGGMPYSDPNPTKLDIPDDKPEVNKLELPGAPPKGRTAMEDVKDIASTAASIASIVAMSDKRVKENIEEIGKLHDGQKVYRYNFKGDPEKHIGLIAQEVEQHHPKAVHEHNGLKMVDYDRATDVAAHAVRANGGRAEYADGGSTGLIDRADLAALLQAQAQMFGPYSQFNRPMGGAPGGAGVVPAGNLPVSGLAVAKGDLPRQMSTIEQATQLGKVGEDALKAYNKGKEAGWWGNKGTDTLTFEGEDEYGDYKNPDINVETPEFDVNPEDKLARGGLAGRHGYALDGGVDKNPDVTNFDLPDFGGGFEFSGRTLAPGAYDEEGKLKPWAQEIVNRVGDIPAEFKKWSESSPSLYSIGESKPQPSGLAAATAAPAATTNVAPQKEKPAAPAARPSGVAPPATRDQVQQFLTDTGGEQFVAEPSAPASPTAERDLGLAPLLAGSTVPGTTTPAGLGAARPAAAKAPAQPGKLNRFLEWASKAENFIPLATGVTGTILAPTRNPLVAAAYGLQSGVQAYQPTLQKQAQLEQTRATTGQIQASVAQTNAQIGQMLLNNQIVRDGGFDWVLLADGSRMPLGKWLLLTPSQRTKLPLVGQSQAVGMLTGQQGPGAVAPAAAPSAVQTSAEPTAVSGATEKPAQNLAETGENEFRVTPSSGTAQYIGSKGREQFQDDFNRLQAMPIESRNQLFAENANYQRSIDAGADASVNVGANLNQMTTQILKLPEGGIAAPGALADVRRGAVKTINDIIGTMAGALGADPNKYQIAEKDIAAGTAADKVGVFMRFAQASKADQNSLGALQAAAAMIPSTIQSKEEAVQLLAGMYIDKQRALDLQNYVREYVQLGVKSGMPQLYLINNAVNAFRREEMYNDRAYNERKRALAALMSQKNAQGVTMYEHMMKKGYTPEVIDKKAAQALYGKEDVPPIRGMANIILGI